jgi:Cu/Ag efflux protein CusF
MMKKLVSRKLVSMLVVALFTLSFAGAAISQGPKGEEVIKMAGTISAISPNTGEVAIADTSGMATALTAGSDVHLKDFKVGDQVSIQYDKSSGIIKSMTKQRKK